VVRSPRESIDAVFQPLCQGIDAQQSAGHPGARIRAEVKVDDILQPLLCQSWRKRIDEATAKAIREPAKSVKAGPHLGPLYAFVGACRDA